MSRPSKPAGPVERVVRRIILGPDRRDLTDHEIRDGLQPPKDGDRRG